MPLLTPEHHLQYLANSSGTPTDRKPNIELTMYHPEWMEIRTCGPHTGTASRRETIAAMASVIVDSNAYNKATGFGDWMMYEGDPARTGKVEHLPAPGLDIMLELLELIEGPNPPQ